MWLGCCGRWQPVRLPVGLPGKPQTPVESGLWDFRLLGRFRAVRLDLAGQRRTFGMVHGPEFGLTPLEREGKLSVRSSYRRRRVGGGAGFRRPGALCDHEGVPRGNGQPGDDVLRGAAQRPAPQRPAHLVVAALAAGRSAEPACCGGHDDGQPAAG